MPKEILLTEDELKQLLKGTLHWGDIAHKLAPPMSRRPEQALETLQSVPANPVVPEQSASPDPDIWEVRDLLYRQGKSYHTSFAGKKVIVLLAFCGLSVLTLWLYFFLSA